MRAKARKSFRSQVKYYYNPVSEVKSQCVYSDKTLNEEETKGKTLWNIQTRCLVPPRQQWVRQGKEQRYCGEICGDWGEPLFALLGLDKCTVSLSYLPVPYTTVLPPINQKPISCTAHLPLSHEFQSTKAMPKHGPRSVRTQDYGCPLLNLSCKPTQKIPNNKCPY